MTALREDKAMLVLERERNQRIRIGDNVVVTVLRIGGGVVRLGIEAPKSTPVHRQEVYDAIQKAKERDDAAS